MTVVRKFLDGDVVADSGLGAREIRVIASTQALDRAGDVVDPAGCDMSDYLKNPIVLASHDVGSPVGLARPKIVNNRLEATIVFAPAGVSQTADTWCGLAKAGVIRGVSIGFSPVESERLPGNSGGLKFTKWSLLEISLVSVPANAEALVVARSHGGRRSAGADESPDIVHIQAIADALAKATKCLDTAYGSHARTKTHLAAMDAHLLEGQRHAEALKKAGRGRPPATPDGSADPYEDEDDPSGDVELSLRAPAEARGGSFLSARVLDDELERLKRFWG